MRKIQNHKDCYISSFIIFSVVIFFTMCINGCAMIPVSFISAGVTLSEERKIDVNLSDKVIYMKVKGALYKSPLYEKLATVSVRVLEGRVLLVGNVESMQVFDEASRCAWSARGVREVINELLIVPNDEKSALKTMVNSKIVAHISMKMLYTNNIVSGNYRVAVNDGVVYLLGIFRNEDELKKLLWLIGNTNGVRSIVNHAIHKNDPRRWDMK